MEQIGGICINHALDIGDCIFVFITSSVETFKDGDRTIVKESSDVPKVFRSKEKRDDFQARFIQQMTCAGKMDEDIQKFFEKLANSPLDHIVYDSEWKHANGLFDFQEKEA